MCRKGLKGLGLRMGSRMVLLITGGRMGNGWFNRLDSSLNEV